MTEPLCSCGHPKWAEPEVRGHALGKRDCKEPGCLCLYYDPHGEPRDGFITRDQLRQIARRDG